MFEEREAAADAGHAISLAEVAMRESDLTEFRMIDDNAELVLFDDRELPFYGYSDEIVMQVAGLVAELHAGLIIDIMRITVRGSECDDDPPVDSWNFSESLFRQRVDALHKHIALAVVFFGVHGENLVH